MNFDGTLWVLMLSFFAFMVVMRSVFFEPIRQMQAKREAQLKADTDALVRWKLELTTLEAECEKRLAEARKQSQQLIQQVRLSARQTASQTLQSARSNAQDSLARKLSELGQAQETVYQELVQGRSDLVHQILNKVKATGGHPSSLVGSGLVGSAHH